MKRVKEEPGDVIERVLRAGSARPDERAALPPFFAARVAALARERAAASGAHPIGLAAWRMLPALGLLVLVFSGVAEWQSREAAEERAAAVASLMQRDEAGGDILFAAALLGGDGPAAADGRP